MEEQELSRRRRRLGETANPADVAEFHATHQRLSNRVERVLMQLVILGLVALVLVQTLAVSPAFRRTVNRMEGTDGYALTQDSDWWPSLTAGAGTVQPRAAVAAEATPLTVTVNLMSRPSAPGAKLLVNGRVAGDFAKPSVTVRVQPGQQIDVDTTGYPDQLVFRVVAAPGLQSPRLGSDVTVRNGRRYIGIVEPKPK